MLLTFFVALAGSPTLERVPCPAMCGTCEATFDPARVDRTLLVNSFRLSMEDVEFGNLSSGRWLNLCPIPLQSGYEGCQYGGSPTYARNREVFLRNATYTTHFNATRIREVSEMQVFPEVVPVRDWVVSSQKAWSCPVAREYDYLNTGSTSVLSGGTCDMGCPLPPDGLSGKAQWEAAEAWMQCTRHRAIVARGEYPKADWARFETSLQSWGVTFRRSDAGCD